MLEQSSNTIKALGIFGRLSKTQEKYFDSLEAKYSIKLDSAGYDIFRHLTLTFINNATVSNIREQLDLLCDLKSFLPIKLKVKRVFVKDEVTMPGFEHIAIEFGLEQTKKLVAFVKKRAGNNTVETPYTKVVWFVPKNHQQAVIDELSNFKELVFTDFYLVSNKQDEANTIYTTSRFISHRHRCNLVTFLVCFYLFFG
ncbi:hypothetical protein HYV64_00005 [Candidatus Shapirobacteria bacterium]|nr:hypothetical protein [Candidatus Shapirobacteria bacterium]